MKWSLKDLNEFFFVDVMLIEAMRGYKCGDDAGALTWDVQFIWSYICRYVNQLAIHCFVT